MNSSDPVDASMILDLEFSDFSGELDMAKLLTESIPLKAFKDFAL